MKVCGLFSILDERVLLRVSEQQDGLEGFMHSPVQLAALLNVLAYVYFFNVLFYQYV